MACLSVIIGQQTCKSGQAQKHRISFNVAIEGNTGDVIVQKAGRKSGEKFAEKDICELPVC